jgi:hypothetical protein
MVYQRRVEGHFRIFMIHFTKELSIKLQETLVYFELKDQIEPKIISFSNGDFLIVWKSKEKCPSLNFSSALFSYGGTSAQKKFDLTVRNKFHGELHSPLNYDILATNDDKIFLTWHQKNGVEDKDYDIYIQIFNKDLSTFKIRFILNPNGLSPTYENQMYPNLLLLPDKNILLSYQTNYFTNNQNESGHGENWCFMKIYSPEGELLSSTSRDILIGSKNGSGLFPRTTSLNDSKIYVLFLFDSTRQDNKTSFGISGKIFSYDQTRKTLIEDAVNIFNFNSNEIISDYVNNNIARTCNNPNVNVPQACTVSTSSIFQDRFLGSYANDNDWSECV